VQAYLKESLKDVENIYKFIKNHPSPVAIRLVKGAYWDYEVIHSKQKNWPSPVYLNKWESDKNFEACASLILKSYPKLRLAIGSHNIRSIAYGVALAQKLHIPKKAIEIQTLYGMAESIKNCLIQKDFRVREYCPMGEPIPGMAYLVRRLLENTANESFLRIWHNNQNIKTLLKTTAKTDPSKNKGDMKMNKKVNNMCTKDLTKNPTKDLTTKPTKDLTKNPTKDLTEKNINTFQNTALLDFSLADHRQKFQKSVEDWQKKLPLDIPIMINNKKKISSTFLYRENPSYPSQRVANVSKSDKTNCDLAIKSALNQFPVWSKTDPNQRADMLVRLADLIESDRYSLAALQTMEVGKNWESADADVCEAIDFCRYYATEMHRLAKPTLTDSVLGEESFYSWQGRGVAVVIAPWNFPLAILTGMVVACLVTGNTVLIKPAEQSSAIAYEFIKLLIKCGLPPGTAHFLPGKGEETGAYLVEQEKVELIAFTGSKEVGCSILEKAYQFSKKSNRIKKCIVEMGGKNAIIVDDSADLDMAVSGVIESAFGFQGQKCSACSRVLVATTIVDEFTNRLVEATHSLKIGPAEKPESRIGPVVDVLAFEKIQSYIEKGKSVAKLISKKSDCPKEGHFISPVIFTHVPLKSPILKEEIFGPVLAIVPFKSLQEAITIANSTEFALTGGFYSRSPSRIETVKRELEVGNLYINRNCTGALVKRHPFGGFKMSGLGSKAGGPDYLMQFMNSKVITENTVRRGFSPHLIT